MFRVETLSGSNWVSAADIRWCSPLIGLAQSLIEVLLHFFFFAFTVLGGILGGPLADPAMPLKTRVERR